MYLALIVNIEVSLKERDHFVMLDKFAYQMVFLIFLFPGFYFDRNVTVVTTIQYIFVNQDQLLLSHHQAHQSQISAGSRMEGD